MSCSFLTQAHCPHPGCEWNPATQTTSSLQLMYVPWAIFQFIGRSFFCPQVECLISACAPEQQYRRSHQFGNVFKHKQLSFQLVSWVFFSSNWRALRVSMLSACMCLHAHQLGRLDLRFPSQQGWPAHPEGKRGSPFWSVQSGSCHLRHH